MHLILLFAIIALVVQPSFAQLPAETHPGQVNPEPIRIRPWLDHESSLMIRHGKLPGLPSSTAPFLPIKGAGRILDLGKPVNQFAFAPDQKSVFALLEGTQTLLHLNSETPPKIIKRYQLSAPSESIAVIRGFLVILQQQLGRLEFRSLSDLGKTVHWKAPEGCEIRGIGLSAKEERAPLIVWSRDLTKTRGVHYDFKFLHSKTLKASPWKLSRLAKEKNNFSLSHFESQWNGKLVQLETSDDGLIAETGFFKLTFLPRQKVSLSFKTNYGAYRTDDTEFLGKKLPFGIVASGIRGVSENCLLFAIYEDEESEAIAVLDKKSLAPICILEGFPGKFGEARAGRPGLRQVTSKISLNENGNQILFTRGKSGKIACYQFDLQKARNEIPAQGCPVNVTLEADKAGRMNLSFCPNWKGDGHHFRLIGNPLGVELDPDTGRAVVTVPVNQTPGSTISIRAEGRHRTGPKIALSCNIEIPRQQ